jgi:sulfide:quinone oxidoreductase
VAILGGGVGGVAIAGALRRQLPRTSRIVLIDRAPQHVFAPSLLWLMVGRRTADAIRRPLSRLARKGIDVRIGPVERLDPERRTVTVAGDTLSAGYIVVALGAELAPDLIPGLADAGHNFYSLDGATAFWTALSTSRPRRIAILTATPAYKCPAAPYEAALLIEAWCRRHLPRGTSIVVYAAEPAPMGVAGPQVSGAVRHLLTSRGIAYFPEHQVTAVDGLTKRLTFRHGVAAEYDLLAYVPPHRAPAVIADAGLAGATGWVEVDRHTLQTRWPKVYAIGDVVSIPLALGKPLPKAGVFAHREAEVVADNIARQVRGTAETSRFDGQGECFIEMGDGKAAFGGGNFFAEPAPIVTLRPPSWRWHLAKVWLEKSWLHSKL